MVSALNEVKLDECLQLIVVTKDNECEAANLQGRKCKLVGTSLYAVVPFQSGHHDDALCPNTLDNIISRFRENLTAANHLT